MKHLRFEICYYSKIDGRLIQPTNIFRDRSDIRQSPHPILLSLANVSLNIKRTIIFNIEIPVTKITRPIMDVVWRNI
jgi:hypothetical protein